MLRLLVFHPLDAGLQGDQLLLDVADPFLGLVLDLGMVGGGWVWEGVSLCLRLESKLWGKIKVVGWLECVQKKMARVRVWLTFSSMSVTPDFTSSISFWKIVNIEHFIYWWCSGWWWPSWSSSPGAARWDRSSVLPIGRSVCSPLSAAHRDIQAPAKSRSEGKFHFWIQNFVPPTVLRLKTLDLRLKK